jgi:hypothetical protein
MGITWRRGPLMRRAAEPRRRAGSQPGPAMAPISGWVSGPILLVNCLVNGDTASTPVYTGPMRARGPILGQANSGAQRVVLIPSPDIIAMHDFCSCMGGDSSKPARISRFGCNDGCPPSSTSALPNFSTSPPGQNAPSSVWLHVMSPASIWPEVGRWGQVSLDGVDVGHGHHTDASGLSECDDTHEAREWRNGGLHPCPAFVVFKRWPRLTEQGEQAHIAVSAGAFRAGLTQRTYACSSRTGGDEIAGCFRPSPCWDPNSRTRVHCSGGDLKRT